MSEGFYFCLNLSTSVQVQAVYDFLFWLERFLITFLLVHQLYVDRHFMSSDVDFEGAPFRLGAGYILITNNAMRGLFVNTVAISLSFSVS